jgi:hypothetical protein
MKRVFFALDALSEGLKGGFGTFFRGGNEKSVHNICIFQKFFLPL